MTGGAPDACARLAQTRARLQIAIDERACLRPIAPRDITPAYVDGLNDSEVNRFLGSGHERTQTYETVAEYVAANEASDTGVLLGLFIDGALRGTVRLHDIRDRGSRATIGVLVFDKGYWRQGWARRAIAATIDWAVRDLDITHFTASMAAENVASRRTFAALGFRHRPELDWTDARNVRQRFTELKVGASPGD